MTTVIYHSADYDGIFCREISRHFLGDKDVKYIGWNFGDPPILLPHNGTIYVMDLPLDVTFGGKPGQFKRDPMDAIESNRLFWIDHHKSAIESHPPEVGGYRIDGVASCRLAWQWFSDYDFRGKHPEKLPSKEAFVDRQVVEPLAVRLAGEYDVCQHDPSKGADIAFQFGLDSQKELDWKMLLSQDTLAENRTWNIVGDGQLAMRCYEKRDAMYLNESGHLIEWEGLKLLCYNTVERGSGKFTSLDVPETGHDALMAFGFRGKYWTVSLYHARHRTDLDLSAIAIKYGGGGHRGACGFTCLTNPPFMDSHKSTLCNSQKS